MICCYGITQQGTYHIEHDLVCQDSHFIKKINDDLVIAAVADGLGSELYTDIASKIAAEESVKYCEANIKEADDEESILDTIKQSFHTALEQINQTAKDNGHDANEYDTTLALAVFLKGDLYYGNSGDGGIVVLNQSGTYEGITKQQRDDNGCVFPLFFGEEKWEFGTKKKVASVLLATDGMYETLFPYLLQGEAVSIYVALARYMMSEDCLNFLGTSEETVQSNMENFVAGIPGDQVSDDKTVVVLTDLSQEVVLLDEEYYKTPDWATLKQKRDEEYKRMAYPHLYGDEQ